MSENRYCAKCEKRTATVYNDFMVEFCLTCHTMRGKHSDYTGQKQPFKCLSCGRMLEETYTGQQVCSDCEYEFEDES